MCGILLHLGKEKLAASHPSLFSITHRGPDASGMVNFKIHENFLSLGHRRLSIVDLSSSANQPMQDNGSSCWITFNGEIYNYIELREELKTLGRTFRTNSDTEVLLNAYLQWGEACLPKLNGMFSFCIWDSRNQTIFIARDRYGIKPLYFCNTEKGFSVVSEIKQLTHIPGFISKVNFNAAAVYLYNGDFNYGEETIWNDVFEIEPGTFSVLDLTRWSPGDEFITRRWYKIEEIFSKEIKQLSLDDASERFKVLLNDAVRLRMRSDVDVGTLLSGGLDSSSVTHLASFMSTDNSPINAFTAVYSEIESDELEGLRSFNSPLVNKNILKISSDDLFPIFEEVAYSHDIPNSGGSVLPYYILYEAISSAGIKVTLEGQGADEGLSGYSNFSVSNMCHALKRLRLYSFIKSAKYHLSEYAPMRINNLLLTTLQYQFSKSAFRRGIRNNLNRSKSNMLNLNDISKDYLLSSIIRRSANNVKDMHLLKMKVLRQILHVVDRSSMAHSVESRSPFLDHRVLEFGFSLATHHKIKNGYRKYLLRKIMKESLPQEINWRRGKAGFTSPESVWVKTDFRDYMLEMFFLLKDFPLVNYKNLINKFNLYLEGKIPYDKTFWRLASFAQWLSTFNLR